MTVSYNERSARVEFEARTGIPNFEEHFNRFIHYGTKKADNKHRKNLKRYYFMQFGKYVQLANKDEIVNPETVSEDGEINDGEPPPEVQDPDIDLTDGSDIQDNHSRGGVPIPNTSQGFIQTSSRYSSPSRPLTFYVSASGRQDRGVLGGTTRSGRLGSVASQTSTERSRSVTLGPDTITNSQLYRELYRSQYVTGANCDWWKCPCRHSQENEPH